MAKYYPNKKSYDTEDEIWRPIKDFDGYLISNLGRVWSPISKKILKPTGVKYYFIVLRKEGKTYAKNIHKLVAESFIEDVLDNSKLVVDHIDGNTHNNNVNNLQLISQRINSIKGNKVKDLDYVGTNWNRSGKRCRARILYNNKRIHLGNFDTRKEASKVYMKAVKEIENNIFNPDDYKRKNRKHQKITI